MLVFAAPAQAGGATHAISPQGGLASPPIGITAGDLASLKQKDPNNNLLDKPKAYLNYVFFDNRFKFVGDGSGVKQVDGDPGQLETLASGKVVAKKNGYVYVYTSNESQQNVLFDNLTVQDITGPVLEETHYYPFGLTMAGISTVAPLKLENDYKFNGIELNHREFSDGTGLELYTAEFRGLDPQIGRWLQIDPEADNLESFSPYEGMGDNPINNTDPLGDFKHRFGAWLYKILHGGGEIGRNQLGEYYVAQTKFGSPNGIATVTTNMIYGKGRDKYSAAREKLLNQSEREQDIADMTRLGVWDPNLSPREAGWDALTLGVNLFLPSAIFKSITVASNTTETETGALTITGLKISEHATERMAERGISKKMIETALSKGTKYFDPKNGTFVYILKNGFASGKDLLISTNTVTGNVTTVLRGSNLVKARFILQK